MATPQHVARQVRWIAAGGGGCRGADGLVNTNSSHCGVLTLIQIQGGDVKKSLELWERRCWRLASV